MKCPVPCSTGGKWDAHYIENATFKIHYRDQFLKTNILVRDKPVFIRSIENSRLPWQWLQPQKWHPWTGDIFVSEHTRRRSPIPPEGVRSAPRAAEVPRGQPKLWRPSTRHQETPWRGVTPFIIRRNDIRTTCPILIEHTQFPITGFTVAHFRPIIRIS